MAASERRPRVLVVGPNSALDEVFRVRGLALGSAARVLRQQVFAGGKAANAAHALALLGARPTLVGFAGGGNGKRFARLARERGIAGALVRCAGETRRTFCFLDERGENPTLVVEEGPPVSAREVAALRREALRRLSGADALLLAGSVPPGCRPELYAELAAAARRRGVPVVVDAHGAPLSAAAAAGVDCLSINEAELAGLAGRRGFSSERAALAAARRAVRAGVGLIVLKCGPRGIRYVGAAEVGSARAPEERGNATGSGDVVTAHAAFALACRAHPSFLAAAAAAAAAANVRYDEPATWEAAAVAARVPAVLRAGPSAWCQARVGD